MSESSDDLCFRISNSSHRKWIGGRRQQSGMPALMDNALVALQGRKISGRKLPMGETGSDSVRIVRRAASRSHVALAQFCRACQKGTRSASRRRLRSNQVLSRRRKQTKKVLLFLHFCNLNALLHWCGRGGSWSPVSTRVSIPSQNLETIHLGRIEFLTLSCFDGRTLRSY